MIKRFFAAILAVLIFTVLANAEDRKPRVTVTTSFIVDMVKELGGNNFDIELIIPAGEDPHGYVAKPSVLKKLHGAELVLHHGLHFEGKISQLLYNANNSHALAEVFDKSKVIRLFEDEEEAPDPHFWFDIELYKAASRRAGDLLQALLPQRSEEINKNTENYISRLEELRQEVSERFKKIPKEKRILVTPHDAFNYFSRSYDIEIFAPQGVSTESESSNADINETVDFIIKNDVKAVFTETTTNPDRMKKLLELCARRGHEIRLVSGEGNELFSDSLAPLGEKCSSYIDMYRHNVDLIINNIK